MKTERAGLYVHIPFCLQKCAYCDFYSLPNLSLRDDYCQALIAQAKAFGEKTDLTFDSVFFGGGTPSAMGVARLCRIADALRQSFCITQDAEWSLEVNPKTVTLEDLSALRKTGFTRVSIGVQSLQEAELHALGRIHSAADAAQAVADAKQAGFAHISVDLMYGIPHQTKESFADTLAQVLPWEIDHLSAYGLKIEDGTLLAARDEKTLDLPNEEDERGMYFSMIEILLQHGFFQYEISNFAKADGQCRHNLKYWTMQPYLALGPASHGFVDRSRYQTKADLAAYLACGKTGDFAPVITEEEALTDTDILCEYTMLRLRLTQGIDDADFQARFGKTFGEVYGTKAKRFLDAGLMLHEQGHWCLTKDGFYLSNYILSDLLEF